MRLVAPEPFTANEIELEVLPVVTVGPRMRLQDVLEGIQGIGTGRSGSPALGGRLLRRLDGETKARARSASSAVSHWTRNSGVSVMALE